MKRCLLLVSALWSVCALASAQASDPKAAKEEARAHFRQGVVLVREGAYGAALVELNRAYELSPDYRVLFNIGQTQLQLGEYVAAIRAFELYLKEGGAEIEPERREAVEANLSELKKRVATLTVTTDLEGATISVDGANVGEAPLKSPLSVSVGRHQLSARAASGASASAAVEVAGGDVRAIHLELREAERRTSAEVAPPRVGVTPSEPTKGRSRGKRAGIGLLSVGGALGLGAVVTGFVAKGAYDRHQQALAEPRGDAVAIGSARDDMKTYAITTDALAVGALALGVTGLVQVLVSDGADSGSPGTELKVGVAPGKLTLQGQF